MKGKKGRKKKSWSDGYITEKKGDANVRERQSTALQNGVVVKKKGSILEAREQ